MILKALCDYYNRRGDLPTLGLELKEIGYLIVINQEGNFLRIESRMSDPNTAQSFLVLQHVERVGKKFAANHLWDKYEYIIGNNDDPTKHLLFVDDVNHFAELFPTNKNIQAVVSFYKNYPDVERTLCIDPLFKDLKKSVKNVSFLLEGELEIVAQDRELWSIVLKHNDVDNLEMICSITGNLEPIARLHSKINLTKDTGPLVSFQKSQGYDSYGKSQCYNAPIGEKSAYAYATALNTLLAKGSRNKFTIGNRTYLFWASSNDEASVKAEESFFSLMGYNDTDDPNANIEEVQRVFKAIYSGEIRCGLDDRFYILGLMPNSARIAVTYWSELSLREFAHKILMHFNDMEIIDTRKIKWPYAGLREMLSTVTLGGKQSDVTPNLPDAVAKSIFQGLPYPYSLFSSCIRRIRAEQKLGICRAAILKAYLNRIKSNNYKITVMLDKENTNPGYLCGRLFAVLDKIQEDANGIHSIQERYMNSASSTPSSVFATILNLSSHHSGKLSDGSRIFYEKIKQEIMDKLPSDGFPAHLDLQDQGRFFVGFYQQRQDFFKGKSEN